MRTTLLAWPLLAACLACAAAPGGAAGGAADLPPELARVLRDYESAWQARDADALASLFTHDGWVMSSGTPPVHGRDAIRAHYANAGGPLALRALAWELVGDLGVLLGGFALAPGEPDVGKFTLTLRRQADGRWLILSDMDNGNSRP